MSFPSISWPRLRERLGGAAFALVFNLLLLLALLTMAPKVLEPPQDPRNPVTFEMAPAPKAAQEEAKAEKSEERRQERPAPERREAEPVIRPPQPVEKPVEQPSPFPFLSLNREQMASADIGRMPKKGPGEGSSGQGDSAAVVGPGEGPGGVQLFEAEWYRRPSHAELAPYLPADAPARGWGLVACKTVDRYHVENCQTLGESPLGSGFARAVRLAAWQFLVLPPRVNGKVMVGSWVRIRIDYTRTPAGAGDDAGAGN
ncbi:hypothetical protein [Sphingobium ummariense]|uniref:TonB C-terminal domain-containing protein n=1 Tax=Sphingobium ummariense RL-3 TaxID=1346791 RepID=T0K956_9SPHN|nr:hypothetical protein [Sphingobium ummariense]EQB33169.1 hypothetical protein M529_05085 [Sphingobium ummariense RL-3]